MEGCTLLSIQLTSGKLVSFRRPNICIQYNFALKPSVLYIHSVFEERVENVYTSALSSRCLNPIDQRTTTYKSKQRGIGRAGQAIPLHHRHAVCDEEYPVCSWLYRTHCTFTFIVCFDFFLLKGPFSEHGFNCSSPRSPKCYRNLLFFF